MLEKLKFSNQPVAWITTIAAVLQVVASVLNHTVDVGTAVNSVIVLLAGVVTWKKVSPVRNEVDVNWVDGVEEVSQDPNLWGDEDVS